MLLLGFGRPHHLFWLTKIDYCLSHRKNKMDHFLLHSSSSHSFLPAPSLTTLSIRMKLEDSLPSSSSRRDQTSPAPEKLRAKRIGCMSALFRLVYNYHSRRRRFLTSGKKQERNIAKTVLASTTTNPKQTASPLQQQKPQNGFVSAKHDPVIKTSCGVPRSPTLPPDMRRARPPALGFNDPGIPERGPTTKADPAEVVAEKRRRLLGALEKCDEDLKTLKKIIEVVKSSVAVKDDDFDANNNNQNRNTSGATKSDDIHFSTASSALHQVTCRSTRYIANVVGRVPQQQKKRPGEEEEISNMCFYDRITSPLDDQVLMSNFHGKTTHDYSANSLWASKAMVESVNEVCKDIESGEKREIGRICLALQDHIWRDLIEEFVGDEVLGFKFGCKLVPPTLPLPFESCKKRLQF